MGVCELVDQQTSHTTRLAGRQGQHVTLKLFYTKSLAFSNLGGQKEQLVIRNIDLYAIACNFGCVLGGSVVASFPFSGHF